jgi:hypothetical protein
MSHESTRSAWREGPAQGAPESSWLAADDDDLLHRIQNLDAHVDVDRDLLSVVQSDRHFFLRQEAAKRIRDRRLLFGFEDDRHIGQILVRHLTRREDLTYLERLVACSRHAEVRRAAQVQLTRLRSRFAAGSSASPSRVPAASSDSWRVAVLHDDGELRQTVVDALPEPEFSVAEIVPGEDALGRIRACDPHLILADVNEVLSSAALDQSLRRGARYTPLVVLCPPDMADPLVDLLGRGADEFILLPMPPALLTAKVRALIHFAHRSSDQDGPALSEAKPPASSLVAAAARHVPATTARAAVKPAAVVEAVDATLLGWAIHFIVEQAWPHLGTAATAGVLRRTQHVLVSHHPTLRLFRVGENAHVDVDLAGGARLPREAVDGVAAWMTAFLGEGRRLAPNVADVHVRRSTRLMADALEQVGFYRAYEGSDGRGADA